jgi:hypothetical protein
VYLYIHSPVRIRGLVFNELSQFTCQHKLLGIDKFMNWNHKEIVLPYLQSSFSLGSLKQLPAVHNQTFR